MDVILFIQYFSFLLCPMTVPVTGTRTPSDYNTYNLSLSLSFLGISYPYSAVISYFHVAGSDNDTGQCG